MQLLDFLVIVIGLVIATDQTDTHTTKMKWLSQSLSRNVPYIRMLWKFSGFPVYAHNYFSHNFSWPFVLIADIKFHPKFEVRSFSRSW